MKLIPGVTYGLIPITISNSNTPGESYKSLCSQIVITHLVNSERLYNEIKTNLEIIKLRYNDDELGSVLIFRIRPISISKKNYDNVVEKGNIISNIKNDLVLIPKKDFNEQLFSDRLPFTHDLNKFGTKLNEKYIVNNVEMPGQIYIYNTDIRLYVEDTIINGSNSITRKIISIKNENNLIEFTDIINDNSNILLRKYRNLTLFIDTDKEKIIKFENSLISYKIDKSKRDLIQDLKISTYDIECFLNENNLFVPFAYKNISLFKSEIF
jgi:hypothetical protein